ncbi:hypothetical protein OEZ86_010803 [Tetradesmus obliquus]|nr:hypothetical protein OEZ86_010803 [Tetradesmus obliquus]
MADIPPDQKAKLESLEQEDSGHERPGITLEQIQQDIEKEMEVMDKVLPESVAEQQAQFEQPQGPAGSAAAEQQKQQRQLEHDP